MRSQVRPFVTAASVLGVLLTLDGCAVGPKFATPEVPLPENWNARDDAQLATQPAVDTQWWKTFNDPTMDRLVDLAYQQNLPLQVAGLRIVEARALMALARGQQYPQLQALVGDLKAVGVPQQVADYTRLDRNFLTYSLAFDAAWEIDVWGRFRRGVEAATGNTDASIADYDFNLVTLTSEVARAYVTIRTYEALIQQTQANIQLQEEGLNIAESRFRNGATTELDPLQAKTLLENTRATVPRLQAALQQTRNALSTLLGQPPGTIDALVSSPGDIPKVPAKVAVSVPAEMLRRRPDIRSAEQQAAAQCARIGIAKSDLYPRFVLAGTVGLQAWSTGQASKNLFSGQSFTYAAGPRIVWPFLNYGRLSNHVRVEDARFQQLLVGYRYTVLLAAQEVEDAIVAYLNAQAAMQFEQESEKAAQRSVEIALVQYKEGAVDFQRVLDSQRSLLQLQQTLSQTTSSVATSLIAIYKALGGGWEVHQHDPVIREDIQTEMKERTNWGDMLSEPRDKDGTRNTSPEKK